jgi:hypothetical protein
MAVSLMRRNPNLKFNVECDNFDEYCRLYFSKLTSEQRQRLPFEIVKKLHLPHKLNFLQKIYVYSVAFGKEGYFIFPPLGDEDTVTVNDFIKVRKSKTESIDIAEFTLAKVGFVLSTQELADTFARAHAISISPAAKYIASVRNPKKKKSAPLEKQSFDISYVSDLLDNYDRNKKVFLSNLGLSITDWYVLRYMYDGKEKNVYPMVEKYRFTFAASARSLNDSFPKLAHMGYIEISRPGSRKLMKYRITTRGLALYNEIISKYITNF